jgi:O-antigen ligase
MTLNHRPGIFKQFFGPERTLHGDEESPMPFTAVQLVGLVLAHALLGRVMKLSPALATLHAYLTFFAVVYLFVRKNMPLERFLIMMGYSLASSVLWRVTEAKVLWFLPEYLCFAVIVLRIWNQPSVRKGTKGIFLFFLLLLPSVPLTIAKMDLLWARDQITYTLMPLLLLTVALFAFSRVRLTYHQIALMLIGSVLPVFSVWAISFFAVFVEKISYGTSSSFAAVGGIAPNQVSNLFSFGAVALACIALFPNMEKRSRLLVVSLSLVLFIQSIMTFSRGGVYNLLVFILVLFPFLLERKRRVRFIIIYSILSLLIIQFGMPLLNEYTEGNLEKRYMKEGSTGRDELIRQDINIFANNPLLGVGPGAARELRQTATLHGVNAHTEFSRMLAEHGIFGLGSVLVLLLVMYRIFKESKSQRNRGMIAACFAWTLTMFAHSATRISIFVILAILSASLAGMPDGGEQEETVA